MHRPRLRHCQPRFAENGAAQKLIRRVLRVKVERRDALPRIAVAKAHIETLRRNLPAPVPTIPRPSEIHNPVAGSIVRDPRRVELRVAVSLVVRLPCIERKWRHARVRADVGKLRAIYRPHHHPIHRHRTRVSRVVHLVETVLRLHQRRRVIPRWSRPSASQPAVAGREIKLHNRPVRLRQNGRAKIPIAHRRIAVRPVIKHRRRGERSRAVIAVMKLHRERRRVVIAHAASHRHRISRSRHQREMIRLINHRRDVRRRHRIGRPRRAIRRRAGRPVLPLVIVKSRVDQLQRFAETIRIAVPAPAAMPKVRRVIALPLRPVAIVRVIHAIHRQQRRIFQNHIVRGIRELPDPPADVVRHRRILRMKRRRIRRDDEIPACRNRRSRRRDGESHAIRNRPAAHIHRHHARILQLDELLRHQLRRRVIHEFIDDNIRPRKKRSGEKNGEKETIFHGWKVSLATKRTPLTAPGRITLLGSYPARRQILPTQKRRCPVRNHYGGSRSSLSQCA